MARRPLLASASSRWATTTTRISSQRGALSALQHAAILTYDTTSKTKNSYDYYNTHTFVRYFCAAPSPTDKNDEQESLLTKTFKTVLTPQNQFYALVAGGTIGAYGISRVFLTFTNFFTHLTPTVVAKWGFYTGFGSATRTYYFVMKWHVYTECFCWMRALFILPCLLYYRVAQFRFCTTLSWSKILHFFVPSLVTGIFLTNINPFFLFGFYSIMNFLAFYYSYDQKWSVDWPPWHLNVCISVPTRSTTIVSSGSKMIPWYKNIWAMAFNPEVYDRIGWILENSRW